MAPLTRFIGHSSRPTPSQPGTVLAFHLVIVRAKFFSKEGMMGLLNNNQDQKGGAGIIKVLMLIVIAFGIFFSVKYYQDSQNDITIHLPKVVIH